MDNKETLAGNRFFPEIEALRGIAAFAVVVEHCFGYFPDAKSFPWIQKVAQGLIHMVFDGRAAVLLFFIMSGFVLGIQLGKERFLTLP